MGINWISTLILLQFYLIFHRRKIGSMKDLPIELIDRWIFFQEARDFSHIFPRFATGLTIILNKSCTCTSKFPQRNLSHNMLQRYFSFTSVAQISYERLNDRARQLLARAIVALTCSYRLIARVYPFIDSILGFWMSKWCLCFKKTLCQCRCQRS